MDTPEKFLGLFLEDENRECEEQDAFGDPEPDAGWVSSTLGTQGLSLVGSIISRC